MTEDRLNNLGIVSIENNVVAILDLKDAIEKFADIKARKKCLYKFCFYIHDK